MSTTTELDPLDLLILDFEKLIWNEAGAKDEAIGEHFGMTPEQYYRHLEGLSTKA
jgi:Protein of unknown function (DUF3263)